jgi:magnesium transporter
VSARLLTHAASVAPVTRDAVAERLRSGESLWVDIQDPDADDLALLRETFEFHPLAIARSEQFDQRPTADDFDGFLYLVVYGWSPDEDGLVEVHCFYAEQYLVTVHRDPSPTLDDLVARLERDSERFPAPPMLLYKVIDGLVEDIFPALQRLDERLDAIEERIFAAPSDQQLQDIFLAKRQLVRLRRVVAPQRDLLGRLVSGAVELPGSTREIERYFRDVYDHLVRLTEEIDGDRELASSAIDAYLSTTSNRLNGTTKQLTLIATIFLPLSFLTGFFGQNFGWMVGEVSSWQAFVLFALVLEAATVCALVVLFRRWGLS